MKTKTGEEKTKEKEIKIGGAYEREQIPENLTDINSLRSIFEHGSNRKDSNQSNQTVPCGVSETKATPVGPQRNGHDEDTVDCSQPSMDDLLTKFRQLELETARIKLAQSRTSRKLKADEYVQRSASLERKANLTYEPTIKETARSTCKGMTIDDRLKLAKSETGKCSTRQQLRRTPAKSVSKPEIDSGDGGSKKKSDVASEYDVSIESIKRSLGIAEQVVDERDDCEEFPSKGTVQALLNQWKSLEDPGSKKKKKRVRFGVDSSWLPQSRATSDIKSSTPIKSCLKSTTAPTTKDKNNKITKALTPQESFRQLNNSKKTSIHEEDAISKAPNSTSVQSLRTTNSINGQTPPPDVVRQVSETGTKPADELPPTSNTKTLLEKFRSMQVQTLK